MEKHTLLKNTILHAILSSYRFENFRGLKKFCIKYNYWKDFSREEYELVNKAYHLEKLKETPIAPLDFFELEKTYFTTQAIYNAPGVNPANNEYFIDPLIYNPPPYKPPSDYWSELLETVVLCESRMNKNKSIGLKNAKKDPV